MFITEALTPMQKGIWSQTKLEGENNQYLIPLIHKISNDVETIRIEQALNDVIQKNEALRVEIVSGNEVYQTIQMYVYHDLALVSVEETAIEESIMEFLSSGISLNESLVQYVLFTTPRNKYLVCKFHHIVFDGQSAEIFLDELIASLNNESQQKNDTLYSSYLKNREYQSDSRNGFWETYLQQEVEEIPKKTNQSIKDVGRRDIQMTKLHCSLSEYKDVTLGLGGTLFTTGLTAFQMLLHKYFDLHHVSTAIPVSLRTSTEERMIGFLANVLPLISHIDASKTPFELHETIQDQVFSLIENRNISASEINNIVSRMRKSTYQSMTQCVFDLSFEKDSLENKLIKQTSINTEYDFLAKVIIKDEEVYFETNVDQALFDVEVITELHQSFDDIIQVLRADTDQTLSSITVLPHAQLLSLANSLKMSSALSSAHEAAAPLFKEFETDKLAISFNESTITYQELAILKHHFQKKLENLYIQRGAKFVVITKNKGLAAILYYCIQQTGHTYIPIAHDHPRARVDNIILEAKPVMIFSDFLESDEYRVTNVSMDNPFLHLIQENILSRKRDNYTIDTSYIIFTSGSTGVPKGVPISYQNILSLMDEYAAFDIDSADSVAQIASLSFDASVFEFSLAFHIGATLKIFDTKAGHEHFPDFVQKNEITHFLMTPEYYTILDFKSCDTLKTILVGGAPYRKNVSIQPHVRVLNAYGPSECSIISSYKSMEDTTNEANIGKAISSLSYVILNSDNHIVPDGQRGQLCIMGKGLFDGYLNPDVDPFIEVKIAEDTHRFFKTGDIVYRDRDTLDVIYTNRNQDMIKIRGNRLNPEEITQLCLKRPGVTNSVTVFHDDRLYNFFVGTETNEAIEHLCRQYLPSYMIPSEFIKLDNIPMTINGKVDMNQLKSYIKSKIDLKKSESRDVLHTDIELKILQVFTQLFDEKEFSLNDNYFEMGGDSIKSIQLASLFQRENMNITSIDIMNATQLKDLSKLALVNTMEFNQQPVVGVFELLPIQKWFFSHEFDNINHWNQSMEFEIDGPLNNSDIVNIYSGIRKKHDVLRSNFIDTDNGKKIMIKENEHSELVNEISFVELQHMDQKKEMKQQLINDLQESLNIERGSVSRLVVMKDSAERYTLVWVIHHLICDNVSWLILKDDFDMAMNQVMTKQSIQLMEKTTNFEGLVEETSTQVIPTHIRAEWERMLGEDRKERFKNQMSSTCKTPFRTKVFEMDELESRALKSFAKKKNYSLDTMMMLLFGRAMMQHNKLEEVWISQELNGRDRYSDNVRLNQTVGWLTSIHPVQLKNKERLDEYLSTNHFTVDKTKTIGKYYELLHSTMETPNISFNYLGEMKDLPDILNKNDINVFDFFDEIALNVAFVQNKFTLVFLYKEHLNQMIESLQTMIRNEIPKLDQEDEIEVFGLDNSSLIDLSELFKI